MKKKIKNFLLKRRLRILKNKKGFSLLEVMIAVGIIGVIAGAGTPIYRGYMKNAKRATSQSTLSQLYRVANLTLTEVDATTGFTKDQVNSKIKGDIQADDVQYDNQNKWCIDILSVNGAPAGCINSDKEMFLSGGGFVPADLKKKSDCEMFGYTWTAGTSTCGGTQTVKSNCTATHVCGA